jgi:hypothetical protein
MQKRSIIRVKTGGVFLKSVLGKKDAGRKMSCREQKINCARDRMNEVTSVTKKNLIVPDTG